MKNKIIIVGDSYTFGHGCSDRILIKDPDVDVVRPWIVGTQWLAADSNQPKSYLSAKESFIKHLYHESMGENTTAMTVIAAWAVSIIHQSKFVWSLPRQEPVLNDKQLQSIHMQSLQFPSINRHPLFTKFNIQDQNIYLAVDGHINDYGHRLYYEAEIKPLLTTLLS